ncbi:DUF882 domain-containing protein [Mycoplana rhizolycopersici]|uniref:Murein endopeptidase K n=1 Tax=Mycoplana rhizolycopersici TaxID=2746702 RepID=A0ABX2QGB0_9HYPH|nr:DUF882 domain-containing protein [Rhizobium rhizolycopersici]NVP55683.1 DUF882 domain-containing protein [Rhizobium rhizolycopersici]
MTLRGASALALCKAALEKAPKVLTIAAMAVSLVVPALVPSATDAASGTRSLKLYYVHTNEKAEIVFKRNGRYDQKGLQQLNRFLRDWRRNEPTKMDPRLFDLVWEVYQKSGSRGYIHVVSAYRSPATNSMLRSRSKGVAKKSQHMLGKAMDFYIPDVKLKKLREIGMKFEVGGVGYYPSSGSPFVHMDVGSVRAWPRMSRQELVSLFPNGKTMHLPSDGKPLPGFEQAVADYKRRVGANAVQVAGGGSADQKAGGEKRKNFFAALFGAGGDEDEEPTAIASAEPLEQTRPAAASAVPAEREALPGVGAPQTQTATPDAKPVVTETEVAELNAPVPLVRPAFRETNNAPAASELALVSPSTNNAAAALNAALPDAASQAAPVPAVPQGDFADLAGYKVPVPELLGKRPLPGEAQEGLMTASVDENLGLVPIPGSRPGDDAALLAVAEADVGIPDQNGKAKVAAVAEAEREDGLSAEAATRVALAAPSDDFGSDEPVQLAALVPRPTSASREALTAFDVAPSEIPLKGSRPKKQDADAAARGAIRTEPKLNQKIISQWALTQARVETLNKPVKAPRFVSRSMREAPTTVYKVGFQPETAGVDPGRFSGTAVNFMEVRKFSDTN